MVSANTLLGTNEVDRIYLKGIFEEHLLRGDGSVINNQTVSAINAIAKRIYETDKLESSDQEALKYLVLICNVLYNRTDMSVLPIEDGFYDLLLEKYKTYDPNFQVGSAVVDFKSFVKKDPGYKEIICPIVKLEPHIPVDSVSEDIYNDIMLTGRSVYDTTDLHTTPIYMDFGDVSRRTHDTKHSHPDLVGTLDKCKFVLMADAVAAGADKDPNVKVLERDFFQEHINVGLIDPNSQITMVLELKYDGVSVEADCTNVVESARSRGDTGIGVASDVTPMLKGYPFPRARNMIGQRPVGVKFEAIMSKSNLAEYSRMREYNYANCRMAMIGLFTASDNYKFRDLITLVPLAVDRDDLPMIPNRVAEIEFCNEVFATKGEPLRYTVISGNVQQCLFQIKKFLEEAQYARDYLDFMYDGIVVSYLDEDIRAKLGRVNYINKYSMAVKFDPLKKTTTFRGYTYEVGQNGQITPMIHYDPVEFLGTIHDKSTGSSLARFENLSLKYGDHIDVTYVNDVMPYVSKPDTEHNRTNPNPVIEPPDRCPICNTKLVKSDSGKTLLCPNMQCQGRVVARTVNMLAKLNLKGFGEQMIKAIDQYSLKDLINLDVDYLAPRIGEGNAANFVAMMNRLKTEPVYDYQLIGALGFSGIATKTWKAILTEVDFKTICYKSYTAGGIYKTIDTYCNLSSLINIKGIGANTIQTIMEEIPYFIDDIEYIYSMPNLLYCFGENERKQIRFSGCRDLQLEEQLCKKGYDADSSSGITKKTMILLVPYEGYESTKTRKMPDSGKIIPIEDFRSNMDSYLS